MIRRQLQSTFFTLTIAAATVLAPSLLAQQGDQGQHQQDSSAVSYTGCLTRGQSPQQYVIADSQTGSPVQFAGPTALDKFVNQTVTIRGAVDSQEGKQVFHPKTISRVSSSCEASPKR